MLSPRSLFPQQPGQTCRSHRRLDNANAIGCTDFYSYTGAIYGDDVQLPITCDPAVVPPSPVVLPPDLPAPKLPALDAKMGFRSYKLGTPFSQFNPDDLEAREAFVKTDMKPYSVKTFDKQLGAAEIDEIQLDFNQDLLQSITVRVKRKQSSIALKETLIAAYGQQDETSKIMSKTDTWNGDDCVLIYRAESIGDDSSADSSSKSVDTKIQTSIEQKAKAGVASGVQNL